MLTSEDTAWGKEARLWNGNVGVLAEMKRVYLQCSINGYGGKLDPGETIDECARRELLVLISLLISRKPLTTIGGIRLVLLPRRNDQDWPHHIHFAGFREASCNRGHRRLLLLRRQSNNPGGRVRVSCLQRLSSHSVRKRCHLAGTAWTMACP